MNNPALEPSIRNAFGTGSPPPQRLIDCECDECRALQRGLEGRRWEELSLHDVFTHGISLLSADAFHYYLPAYLIASLGEEPEAWDVRSYTMHMLKGSTDERMAPWFDARFALLSRPEVAAITAYLAEIALSDDDLALDASDAHARVWKPRLASEDHSARKREVI